MQLVKNLDTKFFVMDSCASYTEEAPLHICTITWFIIEVYIQTVSFQAILTTESV